MLVIYTLLLYAVWTAYHVLLEPKLDAIPNEIVGSLIGDGICKNLVWTLPAVLLILHYKDALAVKPGEFFTWKKEYVKYLFIFPAFCAYIALSLIAQKQAPAIAITASEIITVIFVGVTEELVFRGWLLNATAAYLPEAKHTAENDDSVPWGEYGVIALNAVMFLTVHFPRWITAGEFVTNFTQLGFVTILILSVVFSLAFLRTKNIVLAIALHMFWDLLVFLVY